MLQPIQEFIYFSQALDAGLQALIRSAHQVPEACIVKGGTGNHDENILDYFRG